MKTPTLEEVKEYFKDAKIVKSVFNNEFPLGEIYYCDGSFLGRDKKMDNSSHTIWSCAKGYAKILSYKNEYKITKEQILKLHNNEGSKYVQEWFPECFKKELIVGVWYVAKTEYHKYLLNYSGKNLSYGFCDNEWGDYCFSKGSNQDIAIEATPKEVEEALIKEAKRRYPIGTHIKCLHSGFGIIKTDSNIDYYFGANDMYFAGCQIFKQGVWCDTIPKKKMTISEIEEKLGHGVEVVMDFNVKGTI